VSLRECLPSGRSRSAAKRLQRSRFVWLQAISGPVSLSSAQLSMLL
jgi:hypothetical protein